MLFSLPSRTPVLPLATQAARRLVARIGARAAGSKEDTGPPQPLQAFRSEHHALIEWASRHELSADSGRAPIIGLSGHVCGKPYRMEIGPSTRDFITGEEVRARSDLGIDPEMAVIVIDRRLKVALEERAYSMFTDGDQTALQPVLNEEMRWLAAYDEVGWAGAPPGYWERYSVLAARRQIAQAWLDQELAAKLITVHLLSNAAPFTLVLMRGKCYLRAQRPDTSPSGLSPLIATFRTACEQAVLRFS